MDEYKKCSDCPYTTRIAELEKAIDINQRQHKEFYDRFERMNMEMAVNSERYSNLLSIVTEIKVSVNELKDKPGKKWDNITMTAISCVITLILGLLFGKLAL